MTYDQSQSFHNADEPEDNFTRLPNDLIRHPTLSIETVWLISYLTSHKPGWVIEIKFLRHFLKGRLGRDALQKRIKEAEEAGYIKREHYIKNGMKRCQFWVSKYPKFKKCLPQPENQAPENQAPENTAPLKKTILKEDQYKKEAASKQKKESAAAPSIEDQIKKSRIAKKDMDAALSYFKAHPKKFEKASNPIGLLISLVDQGEHLKPHKPESLPDQHKVWLAEVFNQMGGCSGISVGSSGALIHLAPGYGDLVIKYSDPNFKNILSDRLKLLGIDIKDPQLQEK